MLQPLESVDSYGMSAGHQDDGKNKRVRKKSAKLIEMEEAEALEKKTSKSSSKSATLTSPNAGSRKLLKSGSKGQNLVTSPTALGNANQKVNFKSPPKGMTSPVTSPIANNSVKSIHSPTANSLVKPRQSPTVNELLKRNHSPVANSLAKPLQIKPVSSDQPPSNDTDNVSAIIDAVVNDAKFHADSNSQENTAESDQIVSSYHTDTAQSTRNHVMPSVKTELTEPKHAKSKHKKHKTSKDSKKHAPSSLPLSSGMPSSSHDIYSSVTVKQEQSSGLKLKLCLNSPKETLDDEMMDFQSDDNQPAIWPTKVVPGSEKNPDQVVVKLKKKKSKKHKLPDEVVNGDGLDTENNIPAVKKERVVPDPIVIKPLKIAMDQSPDQDPEPSPQSTSCLGDELVIDTDIKQKDKGNRKKKKRAVDDVTPEDVLDNDAPLDHDPNDMDEMDEIDVEEESSEQGICPVNLYSNTEAMALKLKTSSEKRVSVSAREKKEKTKKKKFRRSGPTAYTMFCNNYRGKVIAENPGSDFAQTSRRLGEIWQCLPAKEKMFWKRKARQCLNKMQREAMAKQTAKAAAPVQDPSAPPPILHRLAGRAGMKQSRPTHKGSKQGARVIKKVPVSEAEAGSSTLLGQLLTSGVAEEEEEDEEEEEEEQVTEAVIRIPQRQTVLKADPMTPCKPIDVAAHLKLLGDSLITIGNRLQEHRVPIAVQGSLSVLLDSSICAMGALMALTNQVPELRTIPNSRHSENLDNIAYIMPGIG